MKFATIDEFHEYVRSLQHRPVKHGGEVAPGGGEVAPGDAELKEACEYLARRLQMLRNEIVDLEYLDVIRPVSQISLRQLVEPEVRCMIRDLRAAWDAMEARISPNGDEGQF
jgi:hypothetical protein